MGKKLNVDIVRSELSEGSAFFPSYTKKVSPTPLLREENSSTSVIPTARPPDEETSRPEDRATGRGVLVRRGFEWREDQLRALKKLSLKEQLEGKQGSMSQMVRDALDDYLKKRAAET
jgi:hypothetical protein